MIILFHVLRIDNIYFNRTSTVNIDYLVLNLAVKVQVLVLEWTI